MADPSGIKAGELAELLRISYKQLHTWITAGYLPVRDARPGTGNSRRFSAAEVERARMLAALVHAGFTSSAAAEAIRQGYVTLPILPGPTS